jgi:hypothetical protein
MLYARAQQADQIMQGLQTLDDEIQQIEIPDALQGLHSLAQKTVQHFAHWATSVLNAIGAPTPDNVARIASARQAALSALNDWHTTLYSQAGATHE